MLELVIYSYDHCCIDEFFLQLTSENKCTEDLPEKTVPSNQVGDRVLTIPADVKKLGVCRDVGETVLHRAARLGYRVRIYSLLCIVFVVIITSLSSHIKMEIIQLLKIQ